MAAAPSFWIASWGCLFQVTCLFLSAAGCVNHVQWGAVAGRSWELLEGLDQGQTQLDQAPDGEMVTWAHPVDLHYASRGLAGWPKLYFQVWSQDAYGRNDICEWAGRRAWNAPDHTSR